MSLYTNFKTNQTFSAEAQINAYCNIVTEKSPFHQITNVTKPVLIPNPPPLQNIPRDSFVNAIAQQAIMQALRAIEAHRAHDYLKFTIRFSHAVHLLTNALDGHFDTVCKALDCTPLASLKLTEEERGLLGRTLEDAVNGRNMCNPRYPAFAQWIEEIKTLPKK